MERLSKNFRLNEFAVSSTGLPNEIPEDVKPAIRALVHYVLQPICDATGWRCRINSGYRSKAVNIKVGGANNSQHTKGEASDNVFYDDNGVVPPIRVLQAVLSLGLLFDQMIAYPTFVHLSHSARGVNRKQVLYSSTYKGQKL